MNHFKIPGREILYAIAFLLIASCTQSSQTTTTDTPDSTRTDTTITAPDTVTKAEPALNTVEDIRKWYAATVSQLENDALDSTSFTYDCSGERSGTVTYFTEKGKLKAITHRYSEYSHYSATDRYYVQDGRLYFAHLNGVAWTFDGPEGATRDDITEQRIYLVNEKPVQCLEKKYTIRSAGTDNPKPAAVPNKQVNCKEDVLKPYRVLLQYHKKPAPACLEN